MIQHKVQFTLYMYDIIIKKYVGLKHRIHGIMEHVLRSKRMKSKIGNIFSRVALLQKI